MPGIAVDYDPSLTIEVPRDDALGEQHPGWAATELERIAAHESGLLDSPEAATAWLEHVRADVAPTATYTLAVRSPDAPALAVLRFDVLDEPLDEPAQRRVLEPPATLPPRHDVLELPGLGACIRMQVLAERQGQPYSLVQWLAVRPGGSVVATLGPLPANGIEAFRPYAEAVVATARPAGLDHDGTPWQEQPSLLVTVAPPVERWQA